MNTGNMKFSALRKDLGRSRHVAKAIDITITSNQIHTNPNQ
jgi:hypothetical protein